MPQNRLAVDSKKLKSRITLTATKTIAQIVVSNDNILTMKGVVEITHREAKVEELMSEMSW